MPTSLEVLLTPAEFRPLENRDLGDSVCVVFDILRATTSIVTALASGAAGVIPVGDIPTAVALRRERPDLLLAGERDGMRIRAHQTGGIDFDLGNSPREFTPDRVQNRTVIMTTTNGTRALRASAKAREILVASFLNLAATTAWLKKSQPETLIVVCSGTGEEPALEDILAAGALCDALWTDYERGRLSDGAEVARQIYDGHRGDLLGGFRRARNGRRLLTLPDLAADVAFCAQRDTLSLVATLHPDGVIRRG